MAIEPFCYSRDGMALDGSVGLVVREGGRMAAHGVRARTLTVK